MKENIYFILFQPIGMMTYIKEFYKIEYIL